MAFGPPAAVGKDVNKQSFQAAILSVKTKLSDLPI